jgi:hypothetical protein
VIVIAQSQLELGKRPEGNALGIKQDHDRDDLMFWQMFNPQPPGRSVFMFLGLIGSLIIFLAIFKRDYNVSNKSLH